MRNYEIGHSAFHFECVEFIYIVNNFLIRVYILKKFFLKKTQQNVFANAQKVNERYDIKGSWVNRNAKQPKMNNHVI